MAVVHNPLFKEQLFFNILNVLLKEAKRILCLIGDIPSCLNELPIAIPGILIMIHLPLQNMNSLRCVTASTHKKNVNNRSINNFKFPEINC